MDCGETKGLNQVKQPLSKFLHLKKLQVKLS